MERRRPAVSEHAAAKPSVSVIIPFHGDLHQLGRCLSALSPWPPRTEIIVAADRAPRETERIAWRHGARVIRVVRRSGPAAARNQAASASRSDILIFIDADVVVTSEALYGMVREFTANPTMAAVFGTYDDDPDCQNFFSQYKNLANAYMQRACDRRARSFWAGFGGIRSEVFRSLGGFDEGFTRPCIEDIELGDRMAAVGHEVLIDRRLHGCHLKRWTFRSMIASDIWDRGVPWTQLMLRSHRVQGLNLGLGQSLSVVMCGLALLCIAVAFWQPVLLVAAAVAIAITLYLNRKLYAFVFARRGVWFACRAAAVNLLYHVDNAFSFCVGLGLHYGDRMVSFGSKVRSRVIARADSIHP